MTLSIQILLPALPPMTSPARLSHWCVAVGQQVAAGEVIAKIDTGESTIEVESTVSGRIERILVPEDSWGMPPNVAIALIAPDEGAGTESDASGSDLWQPLKVPSHKSKLAASSVPEQRRATPAPDLRVNSVAPEHLPASPQPDLRTSSIAPGIRPAPQYPEQQARDWQHEPETTQQAPQQPQHRPHLFQSPAPAYGRRSFTPPRVRRPAATGVLDVAGLYEASIYASLADTPPLEAAPPVAPQTASPSPAPATPQPSAPSQPAATAQPTVQPPPSAAPASAAEPVQSPPAQLPPSPEPAREIVPSGPASPQLPATPLSETKDASRDIPCARLTIDCCISALAGLRPQHQDGPSESGFVLPAATSPGVVFAKALGMALADIPAANVTWTPEGLLHHRSADVAFSVLLPELQVSPVIRNVDRRTLDEVALKVIDLTQRARAKVLDPAELKGAAAAILDLGAYGIRAFEPALEPPHSLNLSLGAKELRPVVVGGEIRSAPIITCTLLCDARAIPFAVAAELLATIKALVEEPRGLILPASATPLF